MDTPLTVLAITQGVSLIALIGLAVVVFALARQIGLLHERITPVGALMTHHGPNVGEYAQVFDVTTDAGLPMKVGGASSNGKRSLLLFTSPTCPVCKKLMPSALSLAREERDGLDLVLISDGPIADHAAFREITGVSDASYVVSSAIGIQYQIGRLPFGVLLDAQGRVLAKGLTNTREHLESLLNVETLGVASIQEYRHCKAQP